MRVPGRGIPPYTVNVAGPGVTRGQRPPPAPRHPTAGGPTPRPGSRAHAKARRAAERRSRSPWFIRQLVLTAALAGVTLGLVMVTQQRWRQGLFGVGAVLLVMALARLALPTRSVGMLAVRGRLFDVVTLLVLGLSVIGLTLTVPIPIPGT
ncbi:DUF3017 domain-containing protein [Pseudofrankia sp. BMG5.36]|uniref:DUF3017 domain-containing protein n=1 Tax=Pseudofrankia sp. BMG5.36 TaxID=1834512 RepID=UPI001F52AD35|nr:DUF3017 domain-containing protein [Pseudofrankia sp. BMG5.36]